VDFRPTPHWFHHTRMPMAIDRTVSQVLTMIVPSAMEQATTQAGLLATLRMMALIPMTTSMIIRRPVSVQLLVVLPPLMDARVRRRPDWTTTLATSDPEPTQKMQMVPRYRNGGAMYLVFLLAPVLECLSLAWFLL
jgi:hypothetical protein